MSNFAWDVTRNQWISVLSDEEVRRVDASAVSVLERAREYFDSALVPFMLDGRIRFGCVSYSLDGPTPSSPEKTETAQVDPAVVAEYEGSIRQYLRRKFEMIRAFHALNVFRTGSISAEGLRVGLQHQGLNVPAPVVEAIVEKYSDEVIDGELCMDVTGFERFFEGPEGGRYTRLPTLKPGTTEHEELFASRLPEQLEAPRAIKLRRLITDIQTHLQQLVPDKTRSHGVAALFLHFDKDRTGVLSYADVADGIERLGLPRPSAQDLVDLLWAIDTDHDCHVGLNEFASLVMSGDDGRGLTVEMSNLQRDPPVEHHRPSFLDYEAAKSRSMDPPTTAALARIVSGLKEDKRALKDALRAYHMGCKGHVNAEGLRQTLQSAGVTLSPNRTEKLLKKYSKGGKLDWPALCRMLTTTTADLYDEYNTAKDDPNYRNPTTTNSTRSILSEISARVFDRYRRMKVAFNAFDKDGTHRISREQFKDGMALLNLELSANDVDAIFRHFDPDNTGHLNYGAFVRMIQESI